MEEVSKEEQAFDKFDLLGQVLKSSHDKKKYKSYASKFMSFSIGSAQPQTKEQSLLEKLLNP